MGPLKFSSRPRGRSPSEHIWKVQWPAKVGLLLPHPMSGLFLHAGLMGATSTVSGIHQLGTCFCPLNKHTPRVALRDIGN